MYPIVEIFGRQLGTYGLVAVIATALCGSLFLLSLKKRGIMIEDGIFFLLFVMGGVVVGSHLLYGLTHVRLIPYLFERVEWSIWVARFSYVFGGSVFYGGLLGGIASGYLGLRLLKQDVAIYSDLMAPLLPLLHGIARVGCFLAGCCYGIPSTIGFAAEGNPLIPAVNGIVRFPVQLLEATLNIILALVLYLLLRRSSQQELLKGNLFKIYLLSYGVIRFLDEFLRGDEIRGRVWLFSTSQWISIFVVLITGTAWLFSRFPKKKENIILKAESKAEENEIQ